MEKRQRAVNKKDRVPFGGLRTKLQVSAADLKEHLHGYHLHWINDKDGRIEAAQNAGYTFVEPHQAPSLGVANIHGENSDLNSKVSKVVSRSGTPIRAYLMKLQQDWHDEDSAAKIAVTRKVDEALRPITQGGQTLESGYTPS